MRAVYQAARRHLSEDRVVTTHRSKNLKTHGVIYYVYWCTHSQQREKNGSGRLPVADAALPREVLFHLGKY